MSILTKSLTAFVVLGAAAGASAASAQTAGSAVNSASNGADLFARDRNLAVRERPHPEYEALGLPLGAFMAFPRLELGAEFNDNIFAVKTGEQDDIILFAKPSVSVVSNWSRHALDLFAEAALNRYQDFGSEDHNNWSTGFDGRVDVTRSTILNAGASYSELTEPRSAASTDVRAAEPIEYSTAQTYLAAARTFSRTKFSGRADWRNFDYQDAETVAGLPIDQDNRDRDLYSLAGRVDYAISPATALFVQVGGNERDYGDASGPGFAPRDSSGYEVLGGANFELGATSRGEVAVGYVSQDFDNAAYSDVDGFAARAQVEWFPTQLTTVTFTGGRSVEDAGVNGAGGYLASSAGVRVDHELRRNIILGAGLSYTFDDYEDIDREDERLNLSANATYLVNRRLGVSLAASRLDQSSDGVAPGRDFTVNRLTVSLVGQF
ncbi:outer membrane beta-barrel protein [Brevundimonas sp.]|uniref:outer membrane beta-barrel protein n=1 Tax=Brevundimonas sp. TaxID=1871086 RepID=UPI003BA9A0FA